MDATAATATATDPRAPARDPAARRGRALAGRLADRVHGLALVPREGQPIETRLWLGDVDGGSRERRGRRALPRFSPGQLAARVCLRPRPRRAHVPLDPRRGSSARSPARSRTSAGRPTARALLVLAADLGADRAGAQTRDEDRGGRRRGAGSEGLPARAVLAPALARRRGDRRDARGQPEGVNVFELGWAGGKVAAVCTDEPSESAWYDAWIGLIDLDARTVERVHTPKWQLQCPRISPGGRVAWIEGFSSDRGDAHRHGARPRRRARSRRSSTSRWIDFADEDTLWVAGWRGAGTFVGPPRRSTAPYRRGRRRRGRDRRRASSRRSRRAPDGSRVADRVRERRTTPPEVVLFENGDGADADGAERRARAEARSPPSGSTYRWESFDGLEIEGLLALPRDHGNGAAAARRVRPRRPDRRWSWMLPAGAHAMCSPQDGYAALPAEPARQRRPRPGVRARPTSATWAAAT